MIPKETPWSPEATEAVSLSCSDFESACQIVVWHGPAEPANFPRFGYLEGLPIYITWPVSGQCEGIDGNSFISIK